MTEKHCKFIYLHRLWISVLMFCVLQIYPVDKVGAQHYSWEEFVEKISVDEYEDGEDLSPLLEELAALHEHPFNLNTATKDDLEHEYESLGKYLKQFVAEELGEVRSIYSDSPIINAVFHNKMSICKEKGIDISCDITGSVKCLDNLIVGSILFNLLDNAIEACEKNQKEKRIICRIAREADEVNIFVENSIEQSVLAENQLLETTKDKKDQHGMGHLIVEEQVKRLGGMVEYYEDKMFCAHVYLPM